MDFRSKFTTSAMNPQINKVAYQCRSKANQRSRLLAIHSSLITNGVLCKFIFTCNLVLSWHRVNLNYTPEHCDDNDKDDSTRTQISHFVADFSGARAAEKHSRIRKQTRALISV